MNEETDRPPSSRLSNCLCQCCAAGIVIGVIGIYLYLDFFGPFPLPPHLEPIVTMIGAATGLVLLLVVLPIGIILGIIYGRRKKAQMQSSESIEKRLNDRERRESVVTHCPTCGASLQGGEQFCPNCGVAILGNETDS